MILREGIFQSWLGGDFLRNKLLACLLLHLGFEVQLLKARVWLDDGQTPRCFFFLGGGKKSAV